MNVALARKRIAFPRYLQEKFEHIELENRVCDARLLAVFCRITRNHNLLHDLKKEPINFRA